MKDNLGLITIWFCLGIIFTHLFRVPFWPVYIVELALIITCAFLIKKGLSFNILLFLLGFILGALCLKNSYITPKNDVSKYIYYKNNTVYLIKGFINNQPVIKDGRVSFIFRAEELQFDKDKYSAEAHTGASASEEAHLAILFAKVRSARYNSCGDILVYAKDTGRLAYGEELILLGNIHRPYRLFRGNISAVMCIKNNSALIRLNKNKGSLFRRLAFCLKDNIEAVFIKRLSPLTASIVDAMVLGEKRRILPIVYDSMIKSGTVHILVVSGFNVGIIAFMAGLFFKILRIPRKLRYFLIIFCLVFYCFITGASAPVVRATVMGIFLILGYFLKREPNITNSLSLAALFILVINPKELFSISFQLSFVSVAAIIYLYPRLKSLFRLEKIKIKFLKVIVEGCMVSLSAWLGTCGFIAYYFKIFSPVTVLANIFIVPLATLITLSGLSMVIISLILPLLSGPFVSTNE
ncbi:MAG: hypothetical protein COX41_01870, partial [Candidatus Omnitrophica bacterium CG23_combo_of_CG06-09_8_20_14_all_41_10]